MQHRDAFVFARIEKANGFDIDKIHFLQIQGYWSATIDLGPYLAKMVRSKRSAQPNSSSVFARNPFDLQGHERLTAKGILNNWWIPSIGERTDFTAFS